MNKYNFHFLLLLLILTFSRPVFSQSEKTNSLPEVIKLFTGAWVASGASDNGTQFESRLVFKSVLNKNFLEVKNHITIDGDKQEFAITTYGWQPVLGHLVFWAFDKDGTINEGMAELSGSVLKHEWRSFSANGEIGDWRSELQLNKSELTFVMYDGKNTQIVLNKLTYKKDG